MHRFEAFWPIADRAVPLEYLIGEARDDLPLLLERAHCKLAGRCRWAIRYASDVPGAGGQGLVLTCSSAAVPVPRLEVEDCRDDPFLRRLREQRKAPTQGQGLTA